MLIRIFNILLFLIIITFYFFVYRYYFSENNIKNIENKRVNVEKDLIEKTSNLPILKNDTNNVIEFNSGFNEQINDTQPRNFWQLLKIK
tara:strand:+ start:605 stop:871 length:267 start_codon:yes stop_codon:yes gene_type:complete